MQHNRNCASSGSVAAEGRTRIYYSESQKALMWELWRKGESLQHIAQLFDRNHSSIQGILAQTGNPYALNPACTESRSVVTPSQVTVQLCRVSRFRRTFSSAQVLAIPPALTRRVFAFFTSSLVIVAFGSGSRTGYVMVTNASNAYLRQRWSVYDGLLHDRDPTFDRLRDALSDRPQMGRTAPDGDRDVPDFSQQR
jgi:hypothetical protein